MVPGFRGLAEISAATDDSSASGAQGMQCSAGRQLAQKPALHGWKPTVRQQAENIF
jgi:hypothetical protein